MTTARSFYPGLVFAMYHLVAMHPERFAALVKLTRLHPGSLTQLAAHDVLVLGHRTKDAAERHGITPSAVSDCLTRIRRVAELVRIAA